jgi:hypothetical protein
MVSPNYRDSISGYVSSATLEAGRKALAPGCYFAPRDVLVGWGWRLGAVDRITPERGHHRVSPHSMPPLRKTIASWVGWA